MEKGRQTQQFKYQEKEQIKKAVSSAADDGHCCHNCGAPLEHGARFCEECGAPVGGGACTACGAAIEPGMEICPVCGHPLTSACTFCGSPMPAGASECPECGNSRQGIVCPDCHVLNFRSFCRKCNRPLNPMALYALEQAKQNKHVLRAVKLREDIAQADEEIAQLEAALAMPEPEPERTLDASARVSDAARRLLDEFASLDVAAPQTESAPAAPAPSVTQTPAPAPTLSTAPGPAPAPAQTAPSRREQMKARLAALKSRRAELDAEFRDELSAMIPDPSDPPAIQRNNLCAFKYAYETTSTKVVVKDSRFGWDCNYCHFLHQQPSECAYPQLGGTWMTKTITETVTETTRYEGTVNL